MALGDLIKKVSQNWYNTNSRRIVLTSNYLFLGVETVKTQIYIHKYDKSLSSYCTTTGLYSFPASRNTINGIAVTSQEDYAFVSDSYKDNRRVLKLSNPASCQPDQPFTEIIHKGTGIDQLSYPCGLYLDNDTYLYTVDRDQNKVLITDTNGNYITHIAGSQGSGSTELWSPHSVTKINDYIYIADTNNSRVAIWKVNSYSPFTVIPTNFIIPLTGYGDGKPRSIASYSNQLYVVTDKTLVIFKIEDDGVTYTEIASFDISNYETNTNYEFDYCNGIAVDVNNIYVVTDDKTSYTYTHILMIDNSFETHSDLHLYQPDFDTHASDNGVNQPIDISIIAGEHFVGAGISSISLTGDSWWQLNQADMSFDFTLEGFMGEFNADLEMTFEIAVDVAGAYLPIPISMIDSGTNDIAIETSSFSLTGEILVVHEANADITIEDFATLVASPPYQSLGSILLPSFLMSSFILENVWASGDLTIGSLDMSTVGGSFANIILGSLEIEGLGIGSRGARGIANISSLIANIYGLPHGYALVNTSLSKFNMISFGRELPNASLYTNLPSLDLIVNSYPSPISIGDIELTNIFDVSGIGITNSLAVGFLELPFIGDVYGFAEEEHILQNKIQLVTLPLLASSEYDITNVKSILYKDGYLYIATDDGLYKIDYGITDNAPVVLTLPSIDMDISVVKRRIDMFITTPKFDRDFTVTIYTEGSNRGYTYSGDTLTRRDGEMRIRFGKGLKRTGRFRTISLNTRGEFELDRIRILEMMKRKER